jgi:hypothetical protein
MSSVTLLVVAALSFAYPPTRTDCLFQSPIARALSGEIIVAQQYGDDDPDGEDPDTQPRDKDLPANKSRHKLPAVKKEADRIADTNVYSDMAPNNGRVPYNGFNH